MFRKQPTASEDQIAEEIHAAIREYTFATRWRRDSVPEDWRNDGRASVERRRQAARVIELLRAGRQEDAWEA